MSSSSKPGKKNSITQQDLLDFKEELLRGQADAKDGPLDQLNKRFEALWQLLKERLEFTDQDLEKQLAALESESLKTKDAEQEKPEPCPKCGRPVLLKTKHCVYCGADEETVAAAMKLFSKNP